ncbi:MAG: thioredoxin-dependent thiol peroxidase [Propionibacteriales bacterium]|nr:thioredoxin-dependent thiol peroxidase [Propionibacteriales bacterium]
MARLESGDTAPAFTLPDTNAEPVSLADFAGSKVVLYFFPAAMTPGCTIEAKDFSEAVDQFAGAGYQVVGVSPDAPTKLAKFRDKEQLTFPLLGDPDREVLDAYGAYGSKMLYGKEVTGVIRSTFLIDVDAAGVGTITEPQYNVRATGHVAKLTKQLGI